MKTLKASQYKIFFVLSILIGLTPLLWFNNQPLAGEEFYALDYAKWWEVFSDSWFSRINFGEYSILDPFKFQGWFFILLKYFGANTLISQIIWHVLLWSTSSVFTYIFLYKLYGKKIAAPLLFIGTAFYVYSPYFLNISILLSPPRLIFALLPLLFLLFLNIHRSISSSFVHINILLISLLFTLFSPIFVNLPSGMVLPISVGVFLVGEFLFLRYDIKRFVTTLGLFVVSFVLLNSWWLFPVINNALSTQETIKSETGKFVTIDDSATHDVISLFGSWAFREQISGTNYYYFPFNVAFDSFPQVFLRYIPFVVLLIAVYLLLSKNNNLEDDGFIIILVLFNVLFLFLSKGTADPFGFVYEFLFNAVPFFWIFREPYAKFIPIAAFTYSGLLVLGLHLLFAKFQELSKHSQWLIYGAFTLVVVSVLSISLPFINSEVVWDVNDGPVRSYRIDKPVAWDDIRSNWKPLRGNYFLFPSYGFADKYNWPSGYSGNPYLILTDANLINPASGYSERPEIRSVTEYLMLSLVNTPEKFKDEARRYNISGTILQKDTAYLKTDHFFSKIEDSYKELETFTNDSASIFEFSSAPDDSLFSLIPNTTIIPVSLEDYSNYYILRNIFKNEYFFQVAEKNPSISGMLRVQADIENNKIAYDLTTLQNGGYTVFLLSNLLNVYNPYTDVVQTEVDDYAEDIALTNVSISDACCQKLIFDTSQNPVEKVIQDDPKFLVMRISDTDTSYLKNTYSSQFIPDPTQVYYVKIDDFDPDFAHALVLDTMGSDPIPIGVSLVVVDKANNSTSFVSSYVVRNVAGDISLNYDPFKTTFLRSSVGNDYYLAFYILRIPEGDGQNFYDGKKKVVVNSLTTNKVNAPYAFYVKDGFKYIQQPPSITDIPYTKINNAIYLVNPTNLTIENTSLVFKNSFNQNWRLYPISEAKYSELEKGGKINIYMTLFSLLMKKNNYYNPDNIEFYANKWDLNNISGTQYVVLFWPHVLSKALFLFSTLNILVLVSYLTIYFYKKRISK